MDYKVVVTEDSEDDLDRYVQYLIYVKRNEQAAKNLMDDFEATIIRLASAAGSLRLCENPKLKAKGYHRINFLSHRYFILYRIEQDIAFIDHIFHELQDYEGKMR